MKTARQLLSKGHVFVLFKKNRAVFVARVPYTKIRETTYTVEIRPTSFPIEKITSQNITVVFSAGSNAATYYGNRGRIYVGTSFDAVKQFAGTNTYLTILNHNFSKYRIFNLTTNEYITKEFYLYEKNCGFRHGNGFAFGVVKNNSGLYNVINKDGELCLKFWANTIKTSIHKNEIVATETLHLKSDKEEKGTTYSCHCLCETKLSITNDLKW